MKFKNRTQAKNETGISNITGINTSSKLTHSEEESHVYTSIFYGAPAKNSGHETCPFASKACRAACLYRSGLAKVEDFAGKDTIKKCRINRTKLFFEEREFFMDWVVAEIEAASAKAERDGFAYSVRLNGTTDIQWENVEVQGFANIFERFPNIQFYDYTKGVERMKLMATSKTTPKGYIPNYHLTFSFTGEGHNVQDCMNVLASGYNVAVVFDVKKGQPLPSKMAGFDVIDGDLTDYRPNDPEGVWVGLRFKESANKAGNAAAIASDFVINVASL